METNRLLQAHVTSRRLANLQFLRSEMTRSSWTLGAEHLDTHHWFPHTRRRSCHDDFRVVSFCDTATWLKDLSQLFILSERYLSWKPGFSWNHSFFKGETGSKSSGCLTSLPYFCMTSSRCPFSLATSRHQVVSLLASGLPSVYAKYSAGSNRKSRRLLSSSTTGSPLEATDEALNLSQKALGGRRSLLTSGKANWPPKRMSGSWLAPKRKRTRNGRKKKGCLASPEIRSCKS